MTSSADGSNECLPSLLYLTCRRNSRPCSVAAEKCIHALFTLCIPRIHKSHYGLIVNVAYLYTSAGSLCHISHAILQYHVTAVA